MRKAQQNNAITDLLGEPSEQEPDELIVEEVIDEEDKEKALAIEEDKKFKQSLESQTFKNPIFVIYNEKQCICWGASFSFEKAYEISIKRALHGKPSISEAEAKKKINKYGFVQLIDPSCRSLPAVIYKIELEV